MSSRQSAHSFSVLLVDDDPHTAAIFALLVEHYGIPFHIASDRASALQYLNTHTPDVIVVDLFLPDVDGYKLLDELSTRVDRSCCRILATTAYYTKDTKQAVLQRGFDGFIQKPFVPDSFLSYLGEAVNDQR